MKRELGNWQKILCTVIVGVASIVAVFLLFHNTVGKSLKTLKTENDELETKYNTLKVYIADMPRYKQEIIDMSDNINNIINNYDVTTTSSTILRHYEDVLKREKISSPSLSYNNPEAIDSVTYSYNGKVYDYTLQQTLVQVSYDSTYTNLMNVLGKLDDKNRNEYINSMNITFGEGKGNKRKINGSMSIAKDTIYGANRIEGDTNIEEDEEFDDETESVTDDEDSIETNTNSEDESSTESNKKSVNKPSDDSKQKSTKNTKKKSSD